MVGSPLLPDGEYTKGKEETYKYLLEYHFPNCTITNHDVHLNVFPPMKGEVNEALIDRKITTNTFSPGPDKIFPAMLQQSTEEVYEIMKRITVLLKTIPNSHYKAMRPCYSVPVE